MCHLLGLRTSGCFAFAWRSVVQSACRQVQQRRRGPTCFFRVFFCWFRDFGSADAAAPKPPSPSMSAANAAAPALSRGSLSDAAMPPKSSSSPPAPCAAVLPAAARALHGYHVLPVSGASTHGSVLDVAMLVVALASPSTC